MCADVKVRGLIYLQYLLAPPVQYPLPVLSLSLPWQEPLLPAQSHLAPGLSERTLRTVWLTQYCLTETFAGSNTPQTPPRPGFSPTSCLWPTPGTFSSWPRRPPATDGMVCGPSWRHVWTDLSSLITGISQPCHAVSASGIILITLLCNNLIQYITCTHKLY